jgi:hypothetical protein
VEVGSFYKDGIGRILEVTKVDGDLITTKDPSTGRVFKKRANSDEFKGFKNITDEVNAQYEKDKKNENYLNVIDKIKNKKDLSKDDIRTQIEMQGKKPNEYDKNVFDKLFSVSIKTGNDKGITLKNNVTGETHWIHGADLGFFANSMGKESFMTPEIFKKVFEEKNKKVALDIAYKNKLQEAEYEKYKSEPSLKEAPKADKAGSENKGGEIDSHEKLANETLDAFKKAGLKIVRGAQSENDYGKSSYFYVERSDGSQQKIRVSDHSVENVDRMREEVHISNSKSIPFAIKDAKNKLAEHEKNKKANDVAWESDVEKTKMADKKWEEIKGNFEGQNFAINYRTYQTLEEFKKKNPNAKNIIQTPIDGGAFSYEYSYDKKPNEFGREKPSRDYIEKIEPKIEKASDKFVEKPVAEIKTLTPKELAKQKLDDARAAFRKALGNMEMGGLKSTPELINLIKAYIDYGIKSAAEAWATFKEDFPKSKIDEKDFSAEFEQKLRESVGEKGEQPKVKKQTSDGLDELVSKNIESDEVRNTLSNIERETGRELSKDEKEYNSIKLREALEHGEDIVEQAKKEFGDDYVSNLLEYLDEKKKDITTAKKSLIQIALELDLERQIQAKPDNVLTLEKQLKLVRDKTIAEQRSAAQAIGYGRLRQIARVGYDISQVTDQFFSSKELEGKKKVEKAIEADAEEINKQAEKNELSDSELESLVREGVEAEIQKIHDKLPSARRIKADKAIAALERIQKRLRSKTYDVTIGLPVALIDAGISVIKRAIKAGVAIADAIELGINHIKEEHGKEWAKEDEFRKDMTDGFKAEGVKEETAKQTVKRALIDAGFGREMKVKGKEPRQILDWRKLAGEEGSVEKMKANVAASLAKEGYKPKEIVEIQKTLEEEYHELRAAVIEHSINELNKRNQKTLTPEQKSAAKKLAELYNYGLFDKNPVKYDILLAKAIGIDRLSPKRFEQAHQLGKALEIMFATKFGDKRLNETELRTGLQAIEDKMRVLLHEEAQQHGSTFLKVADITRTWMDATQRMMLNHLKQGVENPLSGWQQTMISNIDGMLSGAGSTKELRAQKRKIAAAIYKNMILEGGVGYGDVNTAFVNKGNLESYINKMSDNKLFHAISSTAIGKTTLDAADSFFKAKLTEQQFTRNLIKILSQPHLVDGKWEAGMKKQDAINYVSEKLTGQSFADAQKTAKEIIDKVNEGQPKKIISDSQFFIDRLANDIVKAALVNGKAITAKQVTAAYNAAYKSSGRSLGHEPNNPLSKGIMAVTAKMEKDINDAIKEKEYKKAAVLTLHSIFYRNILNPFIAGGTNWIVLKFEKNGLGLASGLYNGIATKVDLTTESGMRNLQKAMYEEARNRDSFMRGAIGGATAVAISALWFGVADTDEYRKWKNRNMWAARYLDLFTPEEILVAMAAKNDDLAYYFSNLIGRNISFDNTEKSKKAIAAFSKGNTQRGFGLSGEVLGGSFGVPIPWRLARDGQNIWLGANGESPYKIDNKPSVGFWSGALKGGFVDYIGLRPEPKKQKSSTTYVK